MTPRENVLNWLQRWHWAIFGSGAIALVICLIIAAYHKGELSKTVQSASESLERATNGWSSAPPSWYVKGKIWQPIIRTNTFGKLYYAGDDYVFPPVSLLKYHETLRELANQEVVTHGIFKLAQRRYGTVPSLKAAQAIVFEASVMDPIVGAARQKMIEDAKLPQDFSQDPQKDVYRRRLIDALADLIELEAEIQGTRSETNWSKHLARLADYVREGNSSPDDGTGVKLTNCLGFSSSIRTWPGKHLSAGSSLRQNKPIEDGLVQLNDLLQKDSQRSKTEERFKGLLAALGKLKNAENALMWPEQNVANTPRSNRFDLYKVSAQELEKLLAEMRKPPDGPMSLHPGSLSDSLKNYGKQVEGLFTNYTRRLSDKINISKERTHSEFLDEIQNRLQSIKEGLNLPLVESSFEDYDSVFLSTNSTDARHLFQIRRAIHEALRPEQIAFPLVGLATTETVESSGLNADDVVAVYRALYYMKSALTETQKRTDHYKLVSKWKTLCDELEPALNALVGTNGEIGSCKVTLVANTNSRANKWKSMNYEDPSGTLARSRTDATNVVLGVFQLDKRIRFVFYPLSSPTPVTGQPMVQPEFGSWPLIRLLLASGTKGEGKTWQVKLPVNTNDFFFLRLEFKTEVPPIKEWRTKASLTWPGDPKR